MGSDVRQVAAFKVGELVPFDKFASCGSEITLVDEDGVERSCLLLKDYDILLRLQKVIPQSS
jgi:hypothetical protein